MPITVDSSATDAKMRQAGKGSAAILTMLYVCFEVQPELLTTQIPDGNIVSRLASHHFRSSACAGIYTFLSAHLS